MASLKEEMLYLGLDRLLALTWLGNVVYTSFAEINEIESKINEVNHQAHPGTTVPERREVQFLKDSIAERESQLRDLGSLSPLSPLEAAHELSQIIPPDLDLKIEAMNIGHTGLTFRGSVPDVPSTGKLDTSLKKSAGKFCNPKVETGTKVGGQTRTKFQAEVTFCQ